MTIQQKQCLLAFLGYYRGKIDGLWGPESREAARRFCEEKNIPGEEWETPLLKAVAVWERADPWAGIRYFVPREFACKCGCGFPAEMDGQLLRMADRVREELGVPCVVSSGLRCPRHNASVGGVSNSRHLTGKAMDFCAAGKTVEQILAVVRKQPQVRYAYAIDGQYVHMDVE